ncbi:MAG: GcvT family protein [Marinibacterium sp.]|nr:GcvT family protein [Marinibacterium sp.]
MTIPTQAQVVIIGGGVVGCSVAYHLTKLGWTDVVLLERKQLTSGTTWHAAGLIGQLRASSNMTKLARYSAELYMGLEAETGVATGMRQVGSVSVALTDERLEELYRNAAMARAFGVPVEELSPSEVKARYEHINIDNVTGGVWLPTDGQADPANIALAMAKGARQQGAVVAERTKVTCVTRDGRRITGVTWQNETGDQGDIACDMVVNCAGMWGHEVGRMLNTNVPLQACEHFYIVSEPIAGLTQMPVLRVPDECAYYKEDAGKMMLGAFEPVSKPWGPIPDNFEFDQLPEDFDHFEPILEAAVSRMPMLGSAGIHTFFNGPESFTPDDAYHLGLAPEMDNVWVAAGFNSIGIQSAGGAGMALAQWMENGEKPFDLGDVDISRMHPFQGNKRYLMERSTETLGLLYADHYPYRQKATARGVRRTPFHHHLAENRAVFGELAGWERANWFADDGQEQDYRYSWKRQNFFGNVAAELNAVRTNVGMYDMSSFGKLRVEGPDAEAFLNLVCGAEMSVPLGKIVYTQFLNCSGGIEADVTVTRLSETVYLVVTPAATRLADQTWLLRSGRERDARITVTDLTASEGVLAVMGPNARTLLQKVSPNDFSNAANPFGTAQEIELGLGLARVHRVSYVGELGWEIYVSADMAGHVFETLWEAGQDMGLKLCGMHMMDCARIEKAFRHFGHDITCEDHVLEAGLGFAVKTAKPDFIGRDAVLRKKDEGLQTRLVQFQLKDPEPLLYHNEPILRDGEIVGYLSSGAYGHHLGAAIGMGYVPCAGEKADQLLGSSFEIDVCGTRVAALASLKPPYDPKSERVRA